jgi:hypothetical protein
MAARSKLTVESLTKLGAKRLAEILIEEAGRQAGRAHGARRRNGASEAVHEVRKRLAQLANRTIQRPLIEERVLSGLTERLVSAEAVAEAVRAYHEEMSRQNQARRAQAEADRKALAKIERAIARIIAVLEDGLYQPTLKARLAELERQKAEIEVRLRAGEPELPDVNPNVAESLSPQGETPIAGGASGGAISVWPRRPSPKKRSTFVPGIFHTTGTTCTRR